jgi:hypothetical protein
VAKYRKKPVVIEAERYRPGLEDLLLPFDHLTLTDSTRGDREKAAAAWKRQGSAGVPVIDTLEGPHYVTPGDWIVTGVRGERYPVKPDIFDATYEAA